MKLNKQPKVIDIVAENHHIWLNLAQAYEAEVSTYTHKKPDINGLYPIDSDITLQNHGYILMKNATPSGFGIVETIDDKLHEICEFYICPHARHNGIGKWFAHHLLNLHQGNWQVKQLQNYEEATNFWRSVIRDFTDNNYTQHRFTDSYWGDVFEQRFTNGPSESQTTTDSNQRLKQPRRLSIPRWPPRKQTQR